MNLERLEKLRAMWDRTKDIGLFIKDGVPIPYDNPVTQWDIRPSPYTRDDEDEDDIEKPAPLTATLIDSGISADLAYSAVEALEEAEDMIASGRRGQAAWVFGLIRAGFYISAMQWGRSALDIGMRFIEQNADPKIALFTQFLSENVQLPPWVPIVGLSLIAALSFANGIQQSLTSKAEITAGQHRQAIISDAIHIAHEKVQLPQPPLPYSPPQSRPGVLARVISALR